MSIRSMDIRADIGQAENLADLVEALRELIDWIEDIEDRINEGESQP